MSMPAGLAKATNYYNKLEAWRDRKALFEHAKSLGLFDQAISLYPKQNAGWRTIDKKIVKLLKVIKDAHVRIPDPCEEVKEEK